MIVGVFTSFPSSVPHNGLQMRINFLLFPEYPFYKHRSAFLFIQYVSSWNPVCIKKVFIFTRVLCITLYVIFLIFMQSTQFLGIQRLMQRVQYRLWRFIKKLTTQKIFHYYLCMLDVPSKQCLALAQPWQWHCCQ